MPRVSSRNSSEGGYLVTLKKLIAVLPVVANDCHGLSP